MINEIGNKMLVKTMAGLNKPAIVENHVNRPDTAFKQEIIVLDRKDNNLPPSCMARGSLVDLYI